MDSFLLHGLQIHGDGIDPVTENPGMEYAEQR